MELPQAWLFTRNSDSVRLTVHNDPAGKRFALVVDGPGTDRDVVAMPSAEALYAAQRQYETYLLRRGYSLELGPPDRRRVAERRSTLRFGYRERRRRSAA